MACTGIPPLEGHLLGEATPVDDTDLSDLGLQARLTLRFLARLVLIGTPLAVVLAATHSVFLLAVAAAVIGLALVVTFPSAGSVRYLGVLLVLAPDPVTVAHLGGSPVSARTLVFALLGGLTVLACLRGRLHIQVPAPLLLTVLALAGFIGAVDNGRTKSLVEFTVLMVLPPVAGAILATDRRLAVELLRGLTAGTLVLIALAIFEAITNHDFLVSATASGTFIRAGHVRTTAGWDYPTTLSAFLCLGGFFVVHVLRTRWAFIGMALGGTLVTAAIITTQARSGLLGLAAGGLTYLLLQRRFGQVMGVLLGLASAVALLMVLPGAAPSSFRDFVGQSLTPGSAANSNVRYRQDLYSDAHAAVAQHPWFGFGYGSGKSVAINELHQYFGKLTDLASLPVSLAVQLGLVGTAATFLFLLLVVFRVIRARELPERLPIAAGLVGCFVAMIGVPVTPPLTWMLLVAGVGWTLTRRDPPSGEPVPLTGAEADDQSAPVSHLWQIPSSSA
jgi:O-antigen ligase